MKNQQQQHRAPLRKKNKLTAAFQCEKQKLKHEHTFFPCSFFSFACVKNFVVIHTFYSQFSVFIKKQLEKLMLTIIENWSCFCWCYFCCSTFYVHRSTLSLCCDDVRRWMWRRWQCAVIGGAVDVIQQINKPNEYMEIFQQRKNWIDYYFVPFSAFKRLLNTNFVQLRDGWLF